MIDTTSIGEIFALVDNVNSDDDDNIEKFWIILMLNFMMKKNPRMY